MELFSVFITGANRGIGLEFVRQLVRLNPAPKHIFATYRLQNTVKELAAIKDAYQENTKIYLIKMDVTNEVEVQAAYKIVDDIVKDDGLTLLINNAGALKRGSFPKMTKEVLDFHFSVNTIAPILLTQIFYPLLKRSAIKHGGNCSSFSKAAILNMSSLSASIENAGYIFLRDLLYTEYKISKTALNMAMRVIAAETKKDNVLMVLMCPGWAKTDMGSSEAEVVVEESIASMLSTISKMNETHNGLYYDRFGKPIPF